MKTQLTQSELWRLSAEALHDQEYRSRYCNALVFTIRDKGLSILDTAGGMGFPSMDLHEAGFINLNISDGDENFTANLQKCFTEQGLQIPVYYSPWQELSSHVKQQFDVVVNADNSFVYMDGWMGGPVVEGFDKITERMRGVLKEFLQVTKQGGLVIIGLGKHYNPATTNAPMINRFKLQKEKEDYDIEWIGGVDDWDKRIHVWTTRINSQSSEGLFVRKSYLITKDELVEQMKQVGFSTVHILEPDLTRDNLIIGIK
jgi:SAM-dependent methyltransferase